MKRLIVVGLSMVLCCLAACSQSVEQSESSIPSDIEYEIQSSYDAGYEAGFEAGVKEGAHNPGDYMSSEEAKAAEEDWEDYFQEYAEENGYYKAN